MLIAFLAIDPDFGWLSEIRTVPQLDNFRPDLPGIQMYFSNNMFLLCLLIIDVRSLFVVLSFRLIKQKLIATPHFNCLSKHLTQIIL